MLLADLQAEKKVRESKSVKRFFYQLSSSNSVACGVHATDGANA